MSAEQPLTISEISRRFPGARGARRVSPSTVCRWIVTGCPSRTGERVRLAATRVGGRWLVRAADLEAFFAKLKGDVPDTPPAARTSAQRDVDSQAAERELIRRGV